MSSLKKPECDSTHATDFADTEGADVVPGTAARPTAAAPFQRVLSHAMDRRKMLLGAGAASATFVLTPAILGNDANAGFFRHGRHHHHHRGGYCAPLEYTTVTGNTDPDVTVPDNYEYDVILRWGDPLFPDAPAFDVANQTPEAQARQFGFNADLVLWYPLPHYVRRIVSRTGHLGLFGETFLGGSYPHLKRKGSSHALMIVNHEYTSGDDMFPEYVGGGEDTSDAAQNQRAVEIEAHGFSVVEVRQRRGDAWSFVPESPFTRRVTGTTPLEIAGPLRGHDLMKTTADPAGETVLGCFNNCAGGKTPWGTIITCEENFDQYFANYDEAADPLSVRIPAPDGASGRKWELFDDRFDLSSDPNEYHRFGFCVEVDPYDPSEPPKKRTALGRFKHEGAAAKIGRDHRVAIYSGDDARFEYVYKFITAGRYDKHHRIANKNLLDEGTLYVARFDAGDTEGDEMGTGEWMPLVWEAGNALDQAGFTSQADVLLNTRGAADALGATPMDRPEDVEVNPKSGHIFIALTNNSRREEPNEANPRIDNQHGHIVELIEDDNDATALTFTWNIFVKCGRPGNALDDSRFGDIADPVAAGVSIISDPDNLVHDSAGNLWIATDGMPFNPPGSFPEFPAENDGIFSAPTEGSERGLVRRFMSGVPNGEVCGPEFSGDERTLFCAIQHPNDGSAFENIWPIDDPDGVSKPSLICIRHIHGRKIGSA
jgi:secreted PhoX family phosphatase